MTIRILSSDIESMLKEARAQRTIYENALIIFPDTIEGRKALGIFAREMLYKKEAMTNKNVEADS